ncbi:MAG: 3-methyl-2-oxobutanoate hydroxymethyltransferase [Planctomycetes bacterium]|nr:3-methyl-2-oxobutanoate hydroxymethyltransferase [Planctomycetota bacterium]
MTKVTTEVLRNMKQAKVPIAVLTAYDYLWARILDSAGVDVLLVGDSLGTVVQGRDTTISVTMEHILYHAELVARAAKRALVVADMPFMSFQTSLHEALRNAGQLLKQSNAEAVKLEGGRPVLDTITHLTDAGIPVMGHLGLTPQSIHKFGSYKVRGGNEEEADQIFDDAMALQDAGAFALVLEKIPVELAARITAALSIPTIGIGAGPQCDGQVLVTQDMVGLFTRFKPRFVRRYLALEQTLEETFRRFVADVRQREFPSEDESY